MMSNGHPRDGFFYPTLTLRIHFYSLCQMAMLGMDFFYPTLTLMIDSYNLGKPRDAKRWSSGRTFYRHTHDR